MQRTCVVSVLRSFSELFMSVFDQMVCRTISRYYIVLAEQGQLDIHTGRAAGHSRGCCHAVACEQ